MTEQDVSLFFAAIFVIGIPILLGCFWSLGRLFRVLEIENPTAWMKLGKPAFSFEVFINKGSVKLPKNMVFLQYKWLLINPKWVGPNKNLLKSIWLFRLFGFLTFIPAAAILFLVFNAPATL